MKQLNELLEVLQGIAKGDIPPTGLILLAAAIVILYLMFRSPKKPKPDNRTKLINRTKAAAKQGNHKTHFRCLTELVEMGEPGYSWQLGECYMNGKGTGKDPRKAMFYFEKQLKETNNPHQKAEYADMLFEGVALPMNKSKAIQLYKEAARKESVRSGWKLWQLQKFEGVDTGFSEDELAWFLFDAAVYKHPGAREQYHKETQRTMQTGREQFTLGMSMFKSKTKSVQQGSFRYFCRSASYGEIYSITMLGFCHMEGIGTSVNLWKAVSYLEFSADLGNANAMAILGDIYDPSNYNVDFSDQEKSLYWYAKAAENGQFEAANRLANHYYYKFYPAKAIYWWEKAIELGSSAAMLNLAKEYYRGKDGYPENRERAHTLVRQAASLGQKDANYYLKLWFNESIPEDPPSENAETNI